MSQLFSLTSRLYIFKTWEEYYMISFPLQNLRPFPNHKQTYLVSMARSQNLSVTYNAVLEVAERLDVTVASISPSPSMAPKLGF